MTQPTKEALQAKLVGTGQEHVLDAYDNLSDSEKAVLAAQILSVGSFAHLNKVLHSSLALLNGTGGDHAPVAVTPPPSDIQFNLKELIATNPAEAKSIEEAGMKLIASGGAAVMILAGGSGTRLGVSIPKGLFTCEKLRQQKSLFQFHCERIRAVEKYSLTHNNTAALGNDEKAVSNSNKEEERSSRCVIQLLIMTSEQNDKDTRDFFTAHAYFGLRPDQVHFFRQSSLPCYDEATGKILMATPHSMCMAPGGNGGLYQSVARIPEGEKESLLQKIKKIGVRYVQIFNVDNILARLGDPCFYGLMLRHGSHVTVKSVPKASPNERVGVFARVDGQWGVVEYTEIGDARASECDPATGELLFNCSHIGCNACSVELLEIAAERMESATLYHAARKSIDTVKGAVKGVKMEAFLFDMFRHCMACKDNEDVSQETRMPFCIMQIERSEEFAPIKNADIGDASDSPATASSILHALHTKWALEHLSSILSDDKAMQSKKVSSDDVKAAIAKLKSGEKLVETSPLLSLQGEGLLDSTRLLVEDVLKGSTDVVLLLAPEEAATTTAKM